MGSERLLKDMPPPEVVADRARVIGIIAVVLDDVIGQVNEVRHAVAEHLLVAFGGELAILRKFVREGGSADEFRAARAAAGRNPNQKEAGSGYANG